MQITISDRFYNSKTLVNVKIENRPLSVTDPGFPVGGGADLVGGAVDPRGGHVSKILHVKTKESGPVSGARPP